jgi:high affinity sulfate transporter 1
MRRLPILSGVLPLERSRLPTEMLAGATLAALAIPEVMGYTKIAGMPVITGLYTILLPLLVFALLGSSRHLVVGADSATAAILAAGLAGMAAQGSSEYVALAGMLAILAAAFLLLARLARLGFLADFLSRTVLIGFLTGVGIQVACEQVAGMLGVTGEKGGPLTQLWGALSEIGEANLDTVLVSLGVLAFLVLGPRLAKAVPWALLAVVLAILASWGLDLEAEGVAVLGTVPSGLPSISWPSVPASDLPELLATAASIFIVILAQSAATSRAYAAKFGDRFDENVDLVGLSAASLSAGVSGTFVVNGSPTKTAMVDSAGGRSQVAQLTTAACVAIVLLFLTAPLSYMPSAVLSAVVFVIAVKLIDLRGMRDVLHRRPVEFGVAALTAAIVVFVGVKEGILAAVALSIIVHLRHSYRPHDRLIVAGDAPGTIRSASLDSGAQVLPGLALYSFGSSMYYANADRLQQETLALAEHAAPKLEWLCVVMSSVGDLDYSAAETLRAMHGELAERDVRLVLAGVTPEVRAELERDGLVELLGAGNVFDWVDEAVAAYRSRG